MVICDVDADAGVDVNSGAIVGTCLLMLLVI